jgi:hypothetical protein
LAPEPASAKAGQSLSNPGKWLKLHRTERSVWGEIQGSGKDPYRAQVDLSGPAFHCSCPSRKFPCKHGLGLMLIFAAHPAKVIETAPPPWVEEYIAKRDTSAERKAAKAEAANKPEDPQAAAKREAERAKTAAKREQSVADGIEELRVWLTDTARHGLAHARQNAARSWDAMAARLMDAKAPGAARLVREMSGMAVATEDWADRLLARLGTLQLLTAAHARLDSLPEPARADVRATLGWTTTTEDLANEQPVTDRWQILGQRLDEEDNLKVQRTWLMGENSKRPALVLNFAAAGRPLDISLVPGRIIDADLLFYPSNFPLRAQVKEQRGDPAPLSDPVASAGFSDALEATAEALAACPWLERLPWIVQGCVPLFVNDTWIIRDQSGHAVPLARNFSQAWTLASISGGHPFTIFGEWDGQSLLPLSAFESGRFILLTETIG